MSETKTWNLWDVQHEDGRPSTLTVISSDGEARRFEAEVVLRALGLATPSPDTEKGANDGG